ncbi:MAG: hypothetical protein KKH44_10210 [Bacteroidetes bacterium]|nr:hypothetical protein [Bacteroidota bacterium]
MRIVTAIAYLIIISTSWSQNSNRQKISGTNLTIELPEGAAIAEHAPIVNFDDIADLNFLEFAEDAAKGMLSQKLDSVGFVRQGAIVQGHNKLIIDQSEANIFFMRKDYELDGFACQFGDTSSYAVVCNSIYPNNNEKLKIKIIEALKTVQYNPENSIDWDKYLSFNFDKTSIFQICKYSTPSSSIRFAIKGIYNQNIYERSNLMCLQFPPSEEIKNSEDLALINLVPTISQFEILEIKKDEKISGINKDEYHFNAICKREGQVFEMYFIGYYNIYSCVTATAFVINSEYEKELIEFIKSFKLKNDGY